jgi:hypothetical protein
MKDGLCNIGNSWVTIHKKMCYRHITYEKLKKISTNLEHVILSRVMRLKILKNLKYMMDFVIAYYV